MDDQVKLALAKWPDVPDCHGWLALDGRGRWRIGHDRQTISHAPTIDYINRNYASDASGRWFFQNGPQRVFVELDLAPYVWRISPLADGSCELRDHTGRVAAVTTGVWLADNGRFLIAADGRIGALHDHDGAVLMERLCDAHGRLLGDVVGAERLACWLEEQGGTTGPPLHVRLPGALPALALQTITASDVARHFGFAPRPQAVGAPAH